MTIKQLLERFTIGDMDKKELRKAFQFWWNDEGGLLS